MNNSTLVALSTAVLLVTSVQGCEAPADETGDAPTILRGEYTTGGDAEIASIAFDSLDRYRLRRRGCSEDSCQEFGAYSFDRANHKLTLVAEGRGPETLDFDVLDTRREPGPAPTTTMKPSFVVPPAADSPPTEAAGGPSLLNGGSTLLGASLIATRVQLLDKVYAGGNMGRQRHLFVIRTKGFIAPITNETLGSLGSRTADAALYAFSSATNLNFSENPPDGSQSSEQYRLWAQVYLDVRCDGTRVSMTLTDPATDAGWEGPLRAEFDPLKTDYTTDGRFAFQAHGRPHPRAEPAFQAVKARTNNTIWYKIQGRVTCDSFANATLHLDDVIITKFPSFRLWVSESSNGRGGDEKLYVNRAQGSFSELWNLPAPLKF